MLNYPILFVYLPTHNKHRLKHKLIIIDTHDTALSFDLHRVNLKLILF
jgi:hypothetical protein